MSDIEHLRSEWLQIPKEDIEVVLMVNGNEHTFSTADTALWLYPEKYEIFNHITQEETRSRKIWFGVGKAVFDLLRESGMCSVFPPYPSDELISTFWGVEMNDYDREMYLYTKTGELFNGNQ